MVLKDVEGPRTADRAKRPHTNNAPDISELADATGSSAAVPELRALRRVERHEETWPNRDAPNR